MSITLAKKPDREEVFKKAIAEAKAVAQLLTSIEGITTELCGAWLWISGETKENKDYLKSVGCSYAPKKKMWYFRSKSIRSYGNRGNSTMQDSRTKYGSKSPLEEEVLSTCDIVAAFI